MISQNHSIPFLYSLKLFSSFPTNNAPLLTKLSPMDGNTASAYVAYHLSDLACIYPITPSSPMGESFEEWSGQGKRNIFGQVPLVKVMQSEGGASGSLHGSAAVGALTSTFTASQGLLLMLPNMCTISGSLLPSVFHVSSRALTYQSLSIYGDHEDINFCRSTGFGLLSSSSVQECMDIGTVAHLASVEASIPILHFFEGFRLSHEVASIRPIEREQFLRLIDFEAIDRFRERALNPEQPKILGHGQRPDVLFQNNEAANPFYNKLPSIVQSCMDRLALEVGRKYNLFDYYGAPDAERVIVIMGAGAQVCKETIDYLTKKGEKVGLITVRLYRPLSAQHFLKTLPKTVKRISVLDRTKEYSGTSEPLFEDVVFTLQQNGLGNKIEVFGGRYGLGSKDFTPDMCLSVYEDLKKEKPKNGFTVGINDDVTFTSLPIDSKEQDEIMPKDQYQAVLWGIGSDGTVGASKSIIKIVVASEQKHGQGYFNYSADKSNSITQSYLRFSKNPITSQYLVQRPNFIGCYKDIFIYTQDHLLDGIQKNGIFLLNTAKTPEEIEEFIPSYIKRKIAENDVKFYILNCFEIDKEIGLGGKINKALQAAFFKLSNLFDSEKTWIEQMEKDIKKEFKLLGEKIIEKNIKGMHLGYEKLFQYKYDKEKWLKEDDKIPERKKFGESFIDDHVIPIFKGEGDILPVSAFTPGGGYKIGTSRYEKKGYSEEVSSWVRPQDCIQCCDCAFVCPRACLRPFVLTEEEVKSAEGYLEEKTGSPKDEQEKELKTVHSIPLALKKKQKEKYGNNLKFRIQISPHDCNGCSLCAQACPKNCFDILPSSERLQIDGPLWEYMEEKLPRRGEKIFDGNDVKSSQFKFPYLEFAGSCEGCSETTYIRLLTQQFGDRMVIANSSGCSSVWGGVYPRTPYAKNKEGKGPAWARSLFEDNAEFGFGMAIGDEQRRDYLRQKTLEIIEDFEKNKFEKLTAITESLGGAEKLKEFILLLKEWIDNFHNSDESSRLSSIIKPIVEKLGGNEHECVRDLKINRNLFKKVSHWVVGGDGWAYDIGYGGLDHVLANTTDVNVFVLDTELYANTGGQCSKATPSGAIAKFSAKGKDTQKKNLAISAMLYGHCYVATVALGNPKMYKHTLDCIREAESYDGPSIILAYCNCQQQGFDVKKGIEIHKLAVDSGYWPLFKYDPRNKEGEKFKLVSPKNPDMEKLKKFIETQGRFKKLRNLDKSLFEKKVLQGIPDQINKNFETLKLFNSL